MTDTNTIMDRAKQQARTLPRKTTQATAWDLHEKAGNISASMVRTNTKSITDDIIHLIALALRLMGMVEKEKRT